VASLLYDDFESGTVGQEPSGWTVTPSNSCLIANDPQSTSVQDYGQVLHVGAAAGVANTRSAVYPFASTPTTGLVEFTVSAMRADAPGVNEFVQVYLELAAGGTYAGLKFSNGGQFRTFQSDASDQDLYTAAGHASSSPTAKTWLEDTWYDFRGVLDLDNSTMTLWMKLSTEFLYLQLGIDVVGVWTSTIPVPAGLVNAGFFGVSSTDAVGDAQGYVDSPDVTAPNVQDTAPTRFTLIYKPDTTDTDVSFALDQTQTFRSYIDLTTPNRQSASTDADNTADDSLNASWQSEDAGGGIHSLFYDFGESGGSDITKELRFVAVLGHNLAEATFVGSPGSIVNLQSITIVGSNDAFPWVGTEVSVDITTQARNPIWTAWLPTHTPCRRYAVRIEAANTGFGGISYIEIGRVIGATEDEIWTAAQQVRKDTSRQLTDPSVVLQTEGNARHARVKSQFDTMGVNWVNLSVSDQDTLTTIYGRHGQHTPVFAMIDPNTWPTGEQIYGHLQARLSRSRIHDRRGRIALSIQEIVS
jgi:hypothetical protein